MPKRVLRHHLENSSKIRRKSMFLEDPSQLLEIAGNESETQHHHKNSTTKHMRVLRHNLENSSKIRRKSMFLEDPSQLLENAGNESETQPHHKNSTTKHMQYIPSNQNNELERLLMHNSKSLLYNVDHSDFPAFNVGMWPQDNCELLNYYPTCSFSVPRPIFIADKQCEKIDICYKRPMNRHFFKTRMRITRTAYQTALKSNKNIRSSIKDNIYHYSVFELAERIYMQPDPFFQSSYDFYFTGGNLKVLPNGRVIHTGGKQLRRMLVSEFSDAEDHTHTDTLSTIATFRNSENCEIFEIQPLATSHNSSKQNCFIARQRNLITMNYLNDKQQIRTITKFRTKSTPFISFAQSQRDVNNFIITTMKQHVRFYDLGGGAPALVKLFEISSTATDVSWNTVKPWRENTFMYANEKQFFMIDIRTSPEQWLKKVSVVNNDSICEHISAVQPSEFNNLFYVATNHKLQCMDIRYLKQSSLSDSVGGISRWTHQLRYAPLMMDTFRLRQSEYIALSSPIAGDLHICELSRERNDDNICLDSSVPAPKHIYNSLCLPYQPPTLLEAYENARLSGTCLRPEANLEARIKSCITGMQYFKQHENSSNSGIGMLLTSNSNGDVFAHTISKREDRKSEERCNKQSDDLMADFEQKLCNQISQPLSYTEIKNMKGLRKVFLCKSLSAVKKLDIDEMPDEYNEGETAAVAYNPTLTTQKPNPKRLHLGRWQKSISTLHSYRDALVPDLLSIWDIDVEEENKIHLGNLSQNIKPDPATQVKHWLEQNVNSDPPMLSIPMAEIMNQIENNTSNVLDASFDVNLTQNTVDFENAIHSTQIMPNNANISGALDTSDVIIQINDGTISTLVSKLKNKKKTKKYVKGF